MNSAWTVCLLASSLYAAESIPLSPPVEEIVMKMQAADRARQESFAGYTATREYRVENSRFHLRATMKVQVTVDSGGTKNFRILEMKAPAPIRKMVFQRMLDTEAKASGRAEQDSTRISPANYSFRLMGVEQRQQRSCFVLEATPKSSNSLLFRGRIWVDAEEHAVVRIQGSPAKNPSYWVRGTNFVHEYEKKGLFWLAATNRSETEVRMFGTTIVHIDYSGYELDQRLATEAAVTP